MSEQVLQCLKDPFFGTLHNLYINLAFLALCLFICLYPINVKMAEPIGPKFFVGHHMTTGKVYEYYKKILKVFFKGFQFCKKKIKFLKIRKFFFKSAIFFLLCFKCKQKELVHNLNRRWGKVPSRLKT